MQLGLLVQTELLEGAGLRLGHCDALLTPLPQQFLVAPVIIVELGCSESV